MITNKHEALEHLKQHTKYVAFEKWRDIDEVVIYFCDNINGYDTMAILGIDAELFYLPEGNTLIQNCLELATRHIDSLDWSNIATDEDDL